MNTTPTPPANKGEFTPELSLFNAAQTQPMVGAADKSEDRLIMHDAEIITPHPYGVYGLCKIIEHLQNN